MQYIIQPGDTLSAIARRFNVTVQAILAANPQIRDPNFIFVGQIIIIPIGPTPPPPPPPPPGVCPRLSRGSTGPAVRDLQTRLRARGFDPGAIDGIFGPRTEAAVIAFQRSVGLFPTGVVDVPTWTALGVNCGIVPPPPPPPPPPTPGVCPRLSRGSTGPAVRDLQTRLRARGFDPGAIDGIFGPRTEAAVIAFQRSVGLAATGVVDVLTWTALGVNCGIVPPPPPPPPPGGRYVVQPGDTLSSIARRFNTTVQRILAANPQITDPNLIFPGQVIIIPA